jgi:hypothetical protein
MPSLIVFHFLSPVNSSYLFHKFFVLRMQNFWTDVAAKSTCTYKRKISIDINYVGLALIILPYGVTIICRYIFLRFWLRARFASTKFCDLYAEMVQGRHNYSNVL